MEATPEFKFKQSEIFSEDEISELYKLFKIIDDSNKGEATQKEIETFMQEMYLKDAIEFTRSDIDAVNLKIGEGVDRAKGDSVDFDSFLTIMEQWFAHTGAIRFTSDRQARSTSALTEEAGRGFHKIIKSFFYNGNFLLSSQLIEQGKEEYQDLENSILDMNVNGKFEQYTMDEKSTALEK